jgi:high-affinity iron transporter
LEVFTFKPGVSFSESPTAIPLAAVTAIIVGSLVGLAIHRASGKLSLHWFFVAASYILLLMAAGICSRSVGFIEDHVWNRRIAGTDELEAPPFDPRTNIWYLPSAWEKKSVGFGFLFSLFGYRAVATIGTIVAYISYWMGVIILLAIMRVRINRRKALESTDAGECTNTRLRKKYNFPRL